MPTVPWQDKGQVVSLRRSRLESAAVEVAVLFRTPDGRYVHRRVRCIGSDLKSGLGRLFDPNPETLAHTGPVRQVNQAKISFSSPQKLMQPSQSVLHLGLLHHGSHAPVPRIFFG
jgi:hypothetical protein